MQSAFRFFSVILLTAFFNHSFGKNNDLTDAYLESVFNSRYRDSKDILSKMSADKKNDIKTKLAFANFWMIMYDTSEENEKYLNLSKQFADEAVSIISAKTKKTYDDIFHLISAESIKLKLEVSKKRFLKAVKDMKDMIDYFEYALEHEENYKMKLIAGMYNYHIETAKEDYPVIYPVAIFYPSGDKQKGLRQIKECSKVSDKSIRIRSYIYLAKIYQKDEKNINAASYYYNKLLSIYPDNLVWRHQYINALLQYNKTEEAEKQKIILKEKVKNSIHITEEQRKFFTNF